MGYEFRDDGVIVRWDDDELKSFRCMGCGETNRKAMDGTGIVIPARERDENYDRLLASGSHPHNIEARPARYLIGLCGDNGSLVSELDGDTWEEEIKAAEDEQMHVSLCCYAPCTEVDVRPDPGVTHNKDFEYAVHGIDGLMRSDWHVRPGSIIRFTESGREMHGRVLDRTYYDGCGRLLPGIYLRTLVLSEDLGWIYLRYVPTSDIAWIYRSKPTAVMLEFLLNGAAGYDVDVLAKYAHSMSLTRDWIKENVNAG